MQVSIVFAAYNGQAWLGDAIANALLLPTETLGFRKEIVACDDGSRDRTFAVIAAAVQNSPLVQPVRLPKRMGLGAALRAGGQHAKGSYTLLCTEPTWLDAATMTAMLTEARRGAAAVFASRYVGTEAPPFIARRHAVLHRTIAIGANAMFGTSLTDVTAGLALIETALLGTLPPITDGAYWQADLLAALAAANVRIAEVACTLAGPGHQTLSSSQLVTFGAQLARHRVQNKA